MATELALRKAQTSDSELLFAWANDPVVRQNSFRQAAICWEEHQQWLAGKLGTPDCRFFILLLREIPAGTLRFDRSDANQWTIGIALATHYRGKGLAGPFIVLGCQALASEFPGARVVAYIKQRNSASLKGFTAAGFVRLADCSVSNEPCFFLQRYV